MFWTVLAAVAVIYAVNAFLSMRQMKNFSSVYSALRRRGRVVIGKQKNALTSGAIVMFLIDADGLVVTGRAMTGITVWTRFKDLGTFDGQAVSELDPAPIRMSASMRKAVANARDNYLTVEAGGIPVEPPTPLMKIINRVDAKVGRRQAPTPVPGRATTVRTVRRRKPLVTD
ncbi:hypothetical protein JS278_01316 [Acidipropionibacterium virtanenii]|uniref:DNA-binding transcriptional activator GutM n=1 Tax=Acidipropionibacterium virtanenii TaxID=2057246 RepID=A0A344UT93_9ACTN|nr:hypothetical protein JS278_01316 [Acidipropionibacterium virtanenii]